MNQSSNNRLKNHVMFSGLAKGADSIFMRLASKYGVGRQIHIRPKGNVGTYKNLPKEVEVLVAGPLELATAYDKIKELLGLNLKHGIAGDLKARNYYQVSKSESVLAVATILNSNTVKGGTSVAVDLSIALNLPTYVLDVTTEKWYQYCPLNKQFIEYGGIPPLTRKFTAVGTRDIENYNILDKNTNQWVPREEFVGVDKANRIISMMEEVFIQASKV